MHALILSVSEVNAAMTKSLPPYLMLHVSGVVPTSGWTQAQLVPATYIVEPEDGIWDFEFMAVCPDGIAAQVVLPITASLTIELPRWCRGVRIRASINAMEQTLFEDTAPSEAHLVDFKTMSTLPSSPLAATRLPESGGIDAWPWLISQDALKSNHARIATLLERRGDSELSVGDLIGRKLRVVPKGGFVTLDLHPNRITFFLDEQGQIENWLPF